LRRRRRRDPVGVCDLLGRATRAFTRAGDSVLTSVRAAWPEATGPGTVNHAYPIRRSRAGVVTVACSDAVWAQEMDMRRDEIADRLTALLDDPDAVAGLRFVVADHAIPGPDPARRRCACGAGDERHRRPRPARAGDTCRSPVNGA
jgi:hypothetical protein